MCYETIGVEYWINVIQEDGLDSIARKIYSRAQRRGLEYIRYMVRSFSISYRTISSFWCQTETVGRVEETRKKPRHDIAVFVWLRYNEWAVSRGSAGEHTTYFT